MYLKLTEGCVCDSLSVNNVEFDDLAIEDKKKVLSNIFIHLISGKESDEDLDRFMGNLLFNFLQYFGSFESSDKACEECGDYVYTYDKNIENILNLNLTYDSK